MIQFSSGKFILGSLICLFTLTNIFHASGQGCSDAGFCSAGSLQAASGSQSEHRSMVSLKATYGAGEKGVTVFQIAPELEWVFRERHSIQASLPYVMTSGKLANHSGIGDALISYSHTIPFDEDRKLGLTLGFRLPTGTTDEPFDSTRTLPMPYQTGLGTTDLILGTSLTWHQWIMAVGVQMVLDNGNKNTYYDSGLGYFDSNGLERGNDALIRVGRLFKLGKVNITPSVLAIYRLNKDEVQDFFGNRRQLKGSDGLTLNLNLAATVPLNERFSLRADAGAPAIVRDVRADGLTRSFAASLAVRYHF